MKETEGRAAALTLFNAGLERVDPRRMIQTRCRLEHEMLIIDDGRNAHTYDLSSYKRVFVIGAGKAGAKMAMGVEDVLGGRISGGTVAVKYGHTAELSRIRLIEAGHPVPDENSVRAAAALIKACKEAGEGDLVINLISGGGSAILAAPYEDGDIRLSLADMQAVTGLLLECGASINEVNCVRKHMSLIKGGRLARFIAPADSISLILSDVIGDDLGTIASGLTVPDETTFSDAVRIIDRYALFPKLPQAAARLFAKGAEGRIPDTPKSGDAAFERTATVLLGTNAAAVSESVRVAESLGFFTLSLGSRISGEAKEVAKVFAGIAKEAAKPGGLPYPMPLCVLAGGETTVTITGDGLGGRNQEMALAFLREFANEPELLEKVTFLSAGTDGTDGPTDAAGAFADAAALKASAARSLDASAYLADNDSYRFFELADALLKTGPTNTNVCDMQILIVRK